MANPNITLANGQIINEKDPNYLTYYSQQNTPVEQTFDTQKINSSTLQPNQDIPAITTKPVNVFDVNNLKYETPELAPTESENIQSSFTDKIMGLQNELLGKSAFTTEQQKSQNISVIVQQQNDLTAQLNALKAQSTNLQNVYQNIPSQTQQNIEGRGITKAGSGVMTAGELRKNSLQQAGIASQALTISANLEAVKGNLATANEYVKMAVAQKYDPITEQLEVAKANLELIKNDPRTSLQDKNRAQKQLDITNAKLAENETAKETAKEVYSLMTEAAKNGADALTLQKIQQATTKEEALALVSEFNETKRLLNEGYTKISGPSQLAGLTEADILRMPNGDIYKKPLGAVADTGKITTKTVKTGAGKNSETYLISYDAMGKEINRELLGKGSVQTTSPSGNIVKPSIQNEKGEIVEPEADNYLLTVIRNSKGGKSVDVETAKSLTKAFNVIGQIGDLQSSISDEDTGPVLGILRSNNPYDVKASAIKAQLTSIVPNLARGVYGEVGVLTDNDVALYSKTLPNLKSPEETRKLLLSMTLKTIQRSVENQIEVMANLGRDVSGLENKYLRIKKESDNLLNSVSQKSEKKGETEVRKETDDAVSKYLTENLGVKDEIVVPQNNIFNKITSYIGKLFK